MLSTKDLLGTRLILNRRHVKAEQEESKALQRAVLLTNWIRALPYPLEEKITFYKATAMAVIAAPRYVRLPAQTDLDPIRRAMTNLDHKEGSRLGHTGPLWRLFQGHATDPYFRVGNQIALQVLLETTNRIDPNGIFVRHRDHKPSCVVGCGDNDGKNMTDGHGSITKTLSYGDTVWSENINNYDHYIPQLNSDGKRLTSHALRVAWRARQWEAFKKSNSRAASSYNA